MDEDGDGDGDDGGDAEDRDGVDALDMNIDEDKGEGEAGVGRVDHLCQHRLHIHILLTSPPGGVREGSAESAHADDDHDECSTAEA